MTEPATTTESIPQWDVMDRMRKALRVAGLTAEQMADYLGISRTSVSNWMVGKHPPSVPVLRTFAARCGVTYEWLAFGTSAVQPAEESSAQLGREG